MALYIIFIFLNDKEWRDLEEVVRGVGGGQNQGGRADGQGDRAVGPDVAHEPVPKSRKHGQNRHGGGGVRVREAHPIAACPLRIRDVDEILGTFIQSPDEEQ